MGRGETARSGEAGGLRRGRASGGKEHCRAVDRSSSAKFWRAARDGTLTLAVAAAESFRRTGKPRSLVSASGVGYYGNRGEEVLTEESAGDGISGRCLPAVGGGEHAGARGGCACCVLRIGVVLARDGGALKSMLPPFRLGLGGRIGSGQQWWSWIELDDVIGAMLFALENESVRGPTNAVAPNPVTNEDFVRALGTVLRRPTIAPLPAFAVRLMLGEMGEELLLTSTRAVPAKLRAAGYVFRYTDVEQALRAALCDRVPEKIS